MHELPLQRLTLVSGVLGVRCRSPAARLALPILCFLWFCIFRFFQLFWCCVNILFAGQSYQSKKMLQQDQPEGCREQVRGKIRCWTWLCLFVCLYISSINQTSKGLLKTLFPWVRKLQGFLQKLLSPYDRIYPQPYSGRRPPTLNWLNVHMGILQIHQLTEIMQRKCFAPGMWAENNYFMDDKMYKLQDCPGGFTLQV